MFDELLECAVARKKTNAPWTMLFSTAVEVIVLGILLLIPLLYTQTLPKAMLTTQLISTPPPPPPPAPPAEAPKAVKPVARLLTQGKLVQPRAIPKQVAVFKEADLAPEAPVAAGGVVGGFAEAGLLGGSDIGLAAPAPPPPPPVAKAPTRIEIGGQVEAAKILSQTQPQYPLLARQMHLQGEVVLHAIIGKDGRVSELEVISGHPLLAKAALEAVKSWRYQPTRLDGRPVEIDTTITVDFFLS
jgi:protein TonB